MRKIIILILFLVFLSVNVLAVRTTFVSSVTWQNVSLEVIRQGDEVIFSYNDNRNFTVRPLFVYDGDNYTMTEAKVLVPSLNFSAPMNAVSDSFGRYLDVNLTVSGVPAGLIGRWNLTLSVVDLTNINVSNISREGKALVFFDRIQMDMLNMIENYNLNLVDKRTVMISNINCTTCGFNIRFLERPSEYVEILVKTGDNSLSMSNKSLWSQEMLDEEKRAVWKQGQIITVKPEGWNWGNLELDPKRFAIVKVPEHLFNENWTKGDNTTRRFFNIPLNKFMDSSDITSFKNIPFNDNTYRPPIKRIINFMDSKIEIFDYDNRPEDDVKHSSSGNFTMCVSGCNYTSVSGFESGEQANLTGSGPAILKISGAWATNDTEVTFNGWTTTADDYIHVYTDSSARHNGKWDDTAYRMVDSRNAAAVLQTIESNIIIEGVQVENTHTDSFMSGIGCGCPTGNNTIKNNIVRYQSGGSSAQGILFPDGGNSGTNYIVNNIVYGAGIYARGPSDTAKGIMYSNTVIGSTDYAYRCRGDYSIMKNNLAFNTTNFVTESGTCHADSNYNMGDDASGPSNDGNYTDISSNSSASLFVDFNNDNYHLISTAYPVNRGIDLSADSDYSFTDDIDGETRTGTWDVGADETSIVTVATSTDEGASGGEVAYAHRMIFDGVNRTHILYIDSESDIHSVSSDDNWATWTDGIDVDTLGYDYDDFDEITVQQGGSTFFHIAYSQGTTDALFYRRCEVNSTSPYMFCGAEQTPFDSSLEGGSSNDDVANVNIILDSNGCVVIAFDFEDDSAAAELEHTVAIVRENVSMGGCGDGSFNASDKDVLNLYLTDGTQYISPVGIVSWGDLDSQVYYINTTSTGDGNFMTTLFNGTSGTNETQVLVYTDIEKSPNHGFAISPKSGIILSPFMGDTDTDVNMSIINGKGNSFVYADTGANAEGSNTNIDGIITMIVDSRSATNDVWMFYIDDADGDDIYYIISNDTTNYSVWYNDTLWQDNPDGTNEIKYLSASFSNETCDITLTWLANSVSPFSITLDTINTGSCEAADTTLPDIAFVSPTPPNNTVTANNSVVINVSINETNLKEVVFNWNGTNETSMLVSEPNITFNFTITNLNNFTFNNGTDSLTSYDEYLYLMMNFDNVSSLGESDSLVVDVSSYENNGTVTGAVVNTSDCEYGNCFTFDGTDGSGIAAGDIEIDSWEEITVSSWFKTGTSSQHLRIVSKDQVGVAGNFIFWFFSTTTTWSFQVRDTVLGGWQTAEYNSTVENDGNWHHLAGTVDQTDNKVYLYMDGVLVASDNFTAATLDDSDNEEIVIGADSDTASYQQVFNGSIDEVRIWNRSLSASEIQQLYVSNLNKYDTDKWSFFTNDTAGNYTFEAKGDGNRKFQKLDSSIYYYYDNQSGLADGIYTYQAFASDTLSNSNSTDERTITIDTVSPSIIIDSPANGTNTTEVNLNITYTVSDALSGIDSCWYYNESMSGNTTLPGCINITDVTWPYGEHNITVVVNDTAGNENSSTITFTIEVGFPTFSDPFTATLLYANDSTEFYITVNDSTDTIENITMYWNDTGTYTSPYNETSIGTTLETFNKTLNISSTAHGNSLGWFFRACDNLGNCANSTTYSSLVRHKGVVHNDVPYTASITFPPQNPIWYDGINYYAFFYPGDGVTTEVVQVAYGDANLRFGTPHDVPTLGTSTRGYNNDFFYGYTTYGTYTAMNARTGNHEVNTVWKSNYDNSTSISWGAAQTNSRAGIDSFPSISISKDSYIFRAGVVAADGDLKVEKENNTFDADEAEFSQTLFNGELGDTMQPQLIPFFGNTSNSGDMGICYSHGNNISYRHYTDEAGSFGSAELLVTDLQIYYAFRCTITRDDTIFLMWKNSSGWFKYKVRYVNGTWTDETVISNTTNDNGPRFTTSSDLGQAKSVYIFIRNGMSMEYRVWNGTGIGDETNFLNNTNFIANLIGAPLFSSTKLPILYHTTDNYTRVKVLDLPTPEVVGVNGTLISNYAQNRLGTQSHSKQAVTVGNKTLIINMGRDHRGWARVVDSETHTVLINDTAVFPLRLGEHHNAKVTIKDNDGYIYIADGGRTAAEVDNVTILKSALPLNDSGFNLTSWTDISPVGISGRGYKEMLVDANGTFYLVFMTDGVTMTIRTYNGTGWTSPVTLIDLNDNDNLLYWIKPELGKEPEGQQQSIHLGWSYRDQSAQPQLAVGSILQWESNYMKLVHTGGGAFDVFMANGSAQSIPFNETNGELVYEYNVTGDRFQRVFQDMGVYNETTPLFVMPMSFDTEPYGVAEIVLFLWNGSGWEQKLIDNTSNMCFSPHTEVVVDDEGTIWVSACKQYFGFDQAVYYRSTDVGETWSNATQLSFANASTSATLLSERSANSVNILWATQTNRQYSELRLSQLQIGSPIISLVSPSDINVSVTTRNWSFTNITSDVDVVNCSINFNGTVSNMTNVSSTSWFFNSTDLALGNYTYNASCTDTGDRTGISANAWVNIAEAAVDSCTYGGSGDWEVSCNDNCSITSDVSLSANTLKISGTIGYFEILANITIDRLEKRKGCQLQNLRGDGNALIIKK